MEVTAFEQKKAGLYLFDVTGWEVHSNFCDSIDQDSSSMKGLVEILVW